MKRPLFNIAVFVVLGEFLAAWSGKMAFVWIAGICVPAILFYIVKDVVRVFYNIKSNTHMDAKLRVRNKKSIWRFSGFALLAAGWCGCIMYLQSITPDSLQRYYEQVSEPFTVVAEGRIERIQKREYDTCIWLSGADIYVDHVQYRNQGVLVSTQTQEFRIGNYIRVQGELKQFEIASNQGMFDLQQYYRSLGYQYTITCKEPVLINRSYDRMKEFLRHVRQEMGENIDNLADEKDAGIFRAVFLGEADAADDAIKELYERQGIAHLLSVSGLHISMIGMVVYRILRRITGSYGVSGILGGMIVIGYGMLTGNSLSTNRSVIMYLISLFAGWRGRIYDMQTSLGIAALFLIADNPLIILQSSFQLSFSAVLGLSAVTDMWKAFLLREEKQGILPVFSLQSMMIPALLVSFYQQPLFSIFINQLILPFGGILIACAAGCACFGGVLLPLGQLTATAGHGVLCYYETICNIFNGIPGGIQVNGRPATWRICTYLVCLAVLMVSSAIYRERKKCFLSVETVPENWKRRRFIVCLCAGIMVYFASWFLRADPVKQLEITMLDVGQGDCFLIRIPEGIDILSDCGSSSEKALAEYTVEPMLLSKGIDTLDAVILSHADEDHINGVVELLERGNIGIERLLLPDYKKWRIDFAEVIEAAALAECPCMVWRTDTVIKAKDAELLCLHPDSNQEYQDTNAASLVYCLTYGNFKMLFTGDIGTAQERELEIGDADVLKVAHHGSKYSSSDEWLRSLSLHAAFISAGQDNRYGHPHQETLDRFQRAEIDCYITSETGAVVLVSDGKQFKIERYKK